MVGGQGVSVCLYNTVTGEHRVRLGGNRGCFPGPDVLLWIMVCLIFTNLWPPQCHRGVSLHLHYIEFPGLVSGTRKIRGQEGDRHQELLSWVVLPVG